MTNQIETVNNLHTLHVFDTELGYMGSLLLEMTDLLVYQLEQAMRALDYGDAELAQKVVSRHKKVAHLESRIDTEVMNVIARHCPVANDLRYVISTSKIAVELARIGDEIVDFAKLIVVLFDPDTSDPNQKLLTDIVNIGGLIKLILDKLMVVFESRDSKSAYVLLQCDRDCETELQEGIKHQLALVIHDARMIRRALDVMQMMKALERCGEHCRNIAEHAIFMLDGIDVRYSGLAAQEPCCGKPS